MNIQSVSRKRELGIDNVNDYIDWAGTYVHSKIEPLERTNESLVVHKLAHIDSSRLEIVGREPEQLERARELFFQSVEYLGIDLPANVENKSDEAEVALCVNLSLDNASLS